MTIDEQKKQMLTGLYDKIKEDIKKDDQDLSADDLTTMVIKTNNQVDFGLRIKKQKFSKMTFFNFDTEKMIDLTQFMTYTNLFEAISKAKPDIEDTYEQGSNQESDQSV